MATGQMKVPTFVPSLPMSLGDNSSQSALTMARKIMGNARSLQHGYHSRAANERDPTQLVPVNNGLDRLEVHRDEGIRHR